MSGPALPEAAAVAAAFADRSDWVGREMARRIREQVEEFRHFEAPELWDQVRQFATATREAEAEAVRRWTLPTEFPADEQSLRLGYEGGASLRTMLQSYRIGHAVAAEAWLEAVAEVIEPAEQARVSAALNAFMFDYEDRLVEWMYGYWEELSQEGHSSQGQFQLARRILEGDATSPEELEYDLEADHVAAIAWGPEALRELTRIGLRLSAPALVLQATEEIAWGWFARSSWNGELPDLSDPSLGGQAGIALGGPGAAVEGFRRAHNEAGDAYVVARRIGKSRVTYGDVAIEALAMQSESASRRFVSHALGELSEDGRRAELMRRTLRTYYRHGGNGAATAQDLGVHEQTIARRLAAATEMLGSDPAKCRVEVEAALRIREMLVEGAVDGA